MEAARLTADLIVHSFNAMGCDAVSVGAYDLSLGIDYLLAKEAEASFPVLSANLRDAHGRRIFKPYRIVERNGVKVGILGLLDNSLKIDKIPRGHKLRVDDPLSAARELLPQIRREGADFVIALTDLTSRPARKLALKELGINMIVSSDKRNQISLPIVVDDVFLTHLDRGGKSVGLVDIFPVGTVAEEELERFTPAGGFWFRNNFIPLKLEIPDHPKIGPAVEETLAAVAEMQKEHVARSNGTKQGGCGESYVGISVCASCHEDRYRAWKTTGHARAYQALEEKNRQFDEACVVCHALAYECDEGELELASIEQFANVQCESCHGPGDVHAASEGRQPMRANRAPESSCLRCHTPERSSDFDVRQEARDICTSAP